VSEATVDPAVDDPHPPARQVCRDCLGDGLSGPGRLLLQHATIMIDSLTEHALIELDGARELDLPANPIVEMFNLLVGRPPHNRDGWQPWDAYQLSLQLLRAAGWYGDQARVWMGCETCGGRGERRRL
jgi:hypothetical protein